MFRYLFFLLFVFIYITLATPSLAQNLNSRTAVENILFDNTIHRLKQVIQSAGKKQTIYAYNIANASTPEFEPILPPEDQRFLLQTFPDGNYSRDTMMELVLSKMAENRAKYSAYINLQKKKFEILRQVSTLGKK